MTTRREKSKSQQPQMNKQLETVQEPPKPQVDHRQEKFADFMIARIEGCFGLVY